MHVKNNTAAKLPSVHNSKTNKILITKQPNSKHLSQNHTRALRHAGHATTIKVALAPALPKYAIDVPNTDATKNFCDAGTHHQRLYDTLLLHCTVI